MNASEARRLSDEVNVLKSERYKEIQNRIQGAVKDGKKEIVIDYHPNWPNQELTNYLRYVEKYNVSFVGSFCKISW